MEFTSLKKIGVQMSSWTRESTADIGLRVFSNNLSNLFKETSIGMQYLILPDGLREEVQAEIRNTAEWSVSLQLQDYESLMIIWLEEILYRLEVHEEFLVDCQCIIKTEGELLTCQAQVSWISSEKIIREIEIKAITSHDFRIKELSHGEIVNPNSANIPQLIGPGWMCDVIFDI